MPLLSSMGKAVARRPRTVRNCGYLTARDDCWYLEHDDFKADSGPFASLTEFLEKNVPFLPDGAMITGFLDVEVDRTAKDGFKILVSGL